MGMNWKGDGSTLRLILRARRQSREAVYFVLGVATMFIAATSIVVGMVLAAEVLR